MIFKKAETGPVAIVAIIVILVLVLLVVAYYTSAFPFKREVNVVVEDNDNDERVVERETVREERTVIMPVPYNNDGGNTS